MSAELKVTDGKWFVTRHGSILGGKPRDLVNGPGYPQVALATLDACDGDTEQRDANATLMAASKKLYEVAAFYADPSNFIVMNDRWYEFGEANIELTQYQPIGTRAIRVMAIARGEQP